MAPASVEANVLAALAPTDSSKKIADLFSSPVWIFPVRKVPDIWKLREIQISESFGQPVSPGVWKDRVVFGPADAGRYSDLR